MAPPPTPAATDGAPPLQQQQAQPSGNDDAAAATTAMAQLLREGLIDTGDLVLFNRRCDAMGPVGAAVCVAAKLYGRYDHLGVVVREEDGALKLLDAGFNGVQYVDLAERVRRSKSHDIAVRRLHVPRTPAMRQAMQSYVAQVTGRTYKQDFFQMLASGIVTPAQWRRERLYLEVQRLEGQVRGLQRDLGSKALTPLERTALEKALAAARARRGAAMEALEASEVSVFENKEDEASGLFCSELAAAAYQRMGLLPRYPASNTYIPTDFATAKPPPVGRVIAALRREGLNLLKGAYLGEEVTVRAKGKDVVISQAAPLPHGGEVSEEEEQQQQQRGQAAGRGWEAGGLDAAFIARALRKYGPTSGLVGERASNAASSFSSSSSPSSATPALPPRILSLFHRAAYRDGQLIDTFPPGGADVGRQGTQQQQDREEQQGLYVIAEGEVDLYRQWPLEDFRHDEDDEEEDDDVTAVDASGGGGGPLQFLATLGPGTAFGGRFFNSLGDGSVLVAKARGGGVRLWRAACGTLVGDPPTRPRTKEERGRVLSVLAHHPYFNNNHSHTSETSTSSSSRSKRQEAALSRFFAVHVRKGECVLSQGERGDNFYVLGEGKAEIVRKKGPSDPFVVSSSVSPGAFFGEAAVLFNSHRGASVRALEDCTLWALGRLDTMELTGKGSPYLLDFFNQHASQEIDGERFMSYDDFYTAICGHENNKSNTSSFSSSSSSSSSHQQQPQPQPPSAPQPGLSDHFPAPVRLLLRALDPKGTGLISFSELVHMDVWMNSRQAHLEVALKLAGRDTGFQVVTLADWAALRDAARRDAELFGGHHQDAMDEAEDERFVARTFRRKFGGRGLFSLMGGGPKGGGGALPPLKPKNTLSVPYDDFVRALHSSYCPLVVRRYLGTIREEVSHLRSGWDAVQGRLLRRATTVTARGHDGAPLLQLGRMGQGRGERGDEDWWAWAKDPRVFGMVVSGGLAGAVARLAVAPLERAKILVQTAPRITTLRDAIRVMADPRYAQAPWGGPIYRLTKGMFVGNGLNMLRILPVLATQAYLYQYLRDKVLQPKRPAFPFVTSSSSSISASDPTWALTLGTGPPPKPPRSSPSSDGDDGDDDMATRARALPLEAKHMLAGGLAGVAANLLVHPLDTVRARITTQQATSRPYAGAVDCARQLVAKDGAAALWRGAAPCALWAFFYIGINYTCLAVLAPLSQGLLHAPSPSSSLSSKGERRRQWLSAEREKERASAVALVGVLAAGTVAQAVAYPFDLLRRRMQLASKAEGGVGMWATARAAMAEAGGGVRGLYRGFPVLLLKLLPTTVISYRVSSAIVERMEE